MKSNNQIEYHLRLANGQGWHITSTAGVKSWVERLASIIGLEVREPNGCPKLIFTEMQPGKKGQGQPIHKLNPNILEGHPRRGWKCNDLKAFSLFSHNDVPDVICEIGPKKDDTLDIVRMWLALHPIYQRAQDFGGLPFHAALVAWERRATLLAAPGGGGKSTCCHRLQPPWHPLCDDETLIVRDGQGRYFAHPFPTWSDYLWRGSNHTWNVQQSFPLSTIFFLEQAETDQVAPIGQGKAAALINESAMQVCRRSLRFLGRKEERQFKNRIFDNACELARVVPAFKLRVSLTGRFGEEMEKALSETV